MDSGQGLQKGGEGMAAIVGLLAAIIVAVVWGFVTKTINENKGYSGGFAWGFFLGLIGLIVVLCKKDNNKE